MIKLIIEIDTGCVAGVFTNAGIELDFHVEILDRDTQDHVEEKETNVALDGVLQGSGWRGIY